jgi:S-adenosylmethionine:tRNA ribosyltransferase-isomerase
MLTDEFDFDLPRDRIAQHPASPRDSARLLEVGRTLHDRTVRDLPRLLRRGDVLVVNDTRVIPARLRGRRGQATIELTLHRRRGAAEWRAFARPAKRLRPGDRIAFADDFWAEVTARREGGEVELRFGGIDADAGLERYGIMPLPPYIDRAGSDSAAGDSADRTDYQTMFASVAGAVAAPTAGLHFTPSLIESLRAAGVEIVTLTLHVGAGTFLPVKAERIEDHHMHSEWGTISGAAADAINAARAAGGRVIATGSTSLRLLETAADADGRLRPFSGDTDIFITPGYRFRIVELMLTNFHLPRSTLFMLVAAFSGLARMRAAYAHAIEAGYRFYSYGDACLLHREDRL